MDILTKDKLETLSDDELKELYKSYKKKAGIQKNIEQAIKLLINSLYGYTGCQYSRFYNRYIAEAITLTGQALIRTSEIAVNEYLKSITGIEKDYVICIHTDSVIGSSEIYVNNKKMTIENYFNSICEPNISQHKEIKEVSGDYTKTYYNGECVTRKINYVMRHKTKKKLYEIEVEGKKVVITEDHSIMVIDEYNELKEIKPTSLDNTKHKIIYISG